MENDGKLCIGSNIEKMACNVPLCPEQAAGRPNNTLIEGEWPKKKKRSFSFLPKGWGGGGDLSEKNNHNILSEEFDIYKCLSVSPWKGGVRRFCIPSRVVVLL